MSINSKQFVVAASLSASVIFFSWMYINNPNENTIEINWPQKEHPSYVLYKSYDTDSFYLDTLTRLPSKLYFEKDFPIDDYIIIPYKGKATTKAELIDNHYSLNPVKRIPIHVQALNDRNMDIPFQRVNAALDALYMGFQIDFTTKTIDQTNPNLPGLVIDDSPFDELYNSGLINNNDSIYAFPITSLERNNISNQAQVETDTINNKEYSFIFGNDNLIDLTFLFVHEFMHVLTPHSDNMHSERIFSKNGYKYFNIMSADNGYCRYALGKDEFQILNEYGNYKLEDFFVGVEDTTRACPAFVTARLEDWCIQNTEDCLVSSASFKGMQFKRGDEVRSNYSLLHDIYFKGIGSKKDFVDKSEMQFLEGSINNIIKQEGLKDINELKKYLKGELVKYQLHEDFLNGQTIENFFVNEVEIEIVNDKFVYLHSDFFEDSIKIKFENTPQSEIKTEDILKKVEGF